MTPFQTALLTQRDALNAQFRAARVNRPTLSGAEFMQVLRSAVTPVGEAACALDPERAEAIVTDLYQVALELYAGGGFRSGALYPVWTQALPHLASFIASHPRRIPAALSNAALTVASTPGARLEEWLARVVQAAAHTRDSDALLRAGQVAAWRSGLAHFRESALSVAATLPDPVARAALSLPLEAKVTASLKHLSADPWYDPLAPHAPAQHLYRLGGFRGFGGPFTALPQAGLHDGQLAVQSGPDVWRVFADSFGATLKRISSSDVTRTKLESKVSTQAVLTDPASTASDGQRIAVTTARSYYLFVLPRA
jgi:hypothetical protein